MTDSENKRIEERSPVIVVMGHIDHGKSTLLDYIRKTNVVQGEEGGITQKISAYELNWEKDGIQKKITFLDTPGHEAFSKVRLQGASIADVAILVVSAEDGIKEQTLESLKQIKEIGIPYIVAINKIDLPGANVEKVKNQLVENEVYVEGYGGDIPSVPISAKKGDGIDDLLDMILLVAEIQELKADRKKPAEGVVIEAHMDSKRGISATLIIKDGSIKTGECVVAENSFAPTKIMEDFAGKKITEASFSSPIQIVGWNKLPKVGAHFQTCPNKKEAVKLATSHKEEVIRKEISDEENPDKVVIPVVIKVDVSGSISAIEHEISKMKLEMVEIKILEKSIGNISEADIKRVGTAGKPIILGFNIGVGGDVEKLAEVHGIEIKTFSIIYKLTEYLEEVIKERSPKIEMEEIIGKAKILKSFSQAKSKQVLGGKMREGLLKLGMTVNIYRQENKIGQGKILEIQTQKVKTTEVSGENEFGIKIDSKTEIAPGDFVEAVTIVSKKVR
jgi:translation initiation factor IF-2